MTASPKSATAPANLEEEKLAHALVSRGLLTRDEYQKFRNAEGAASPGSPEEILRRLVKARCLTEPQGQRLLAELPTLMNQQIPGYEVLEKLGQGSMGTVFKARQLSMDRLVAIKVLSPKLAANKSFLERFQREAHLAARFSSNNVVQAIDVGAAGNIQYFVMEYVEGVTIKEELEKGKLYEENEAVEIVLQIAQALQHAHRRQLIHRDIKPANIILTKDGIAKLADLGMARITTDQVTAKAEKGMTIGTPYYIAPEQVKSREDVDSRADMYSLGATLYHMVTGKPPFPYKKVEEVLKAHLDEELTPPDHLNQKLSAGLGEVVEFMMAKKRNKRYPSPDELIIDLECLLHGDPPKFARQRLDAERLKDLGVGEADEDDEDQPRRKSRKKTVPLEVAIALAAGVALSLLLNIYLMLR